eukprot:8061619-Pyramimonas_sp.AAC.2
MAVCGVVRDVGICRRERTTNISQEFDNKLLPFKIRTRTPRAISTWTNDVFDVRKMRIEIAPEYMMFNMSEVMKMMMDFFCVAKCCSKFGWWASRLRK